MIWKFSRYREVIREYGFCVMCFGSTRQADEKVIAALIDSRKHFYDLNRHFESETRFRERGIGGLKCSDLTKAEWSALLVALRERQESCRRVPHDKNTRVYW